MALHGHTKIELHNVKTGEDTVIEKHNIFTNYLHDIMQVVLTPKLTNWMSCSKNSQRYGTTQWNNQNNANNNLPRITDILCGGILCLANQHEENPDNYFLTRDDVVTARGANIANGSEDLSLGSYNVSLEQSSDTSKTMVWDFSQSQGNGTISTIGLTNIGMALCGLGGFPSTMTHSEANPFGDVCLAKDFVIATGGHYDDDYPDTDPCYGVPMYISLEKGKLISFLGITSKILDLRYYDLNCNVINPMNRVGSKLSSSGTKYKYCGVDYYSGKIDRYSPTKRVQFDLSTYPFAGYSYLNMIVTNDGHMYICPHNTTQWSPNATITFVKIDLMNQEVVGTFEMTNTTGIKLYLSASTAIGKTSTGVSELYYYRCPIFDKYMLFKGYDEDRTFAINMENNTDVKEILKEDGSPFGMGRFLMDFADGMLCVEIGNENYQERPVYIVDPKNGKAFCVRTGSLHNDYWVLNGGSTNQTYVLRVPSDNELLNFWASGYSTSLKYNSSSLVFLSYKQDALSTINVLDEPVVKTADMTMRITYTISLEADEGEAEE